METIEAYVDAHPPARKGTECGTCAAKRARPELWIEVLRGRVLGYSLSFLATFLRAQGVQLSGAQLRDHFQKGHD